MEQQGNHYHLTAEESRQLMENTLHPMEDNLAQRHQVLTEIDRMMQGLQVGPKGSVFVQDSSVEEDDLVKLLSSVRKDRKAQTVGLAQLVEEQIDQFLPKAL